MEKKLAIGTFAEISENDLYALFGGNVIIPLGGIIFRCNIVYSDTAFRDACIWGAGSAGGAAEAGAVGFATSTASSINNRTAHFDYGLNF